MAPSGKKHGFAGLPAEGLDASSVRTIVKDLHAADPYEAPDGKVWGGVYHDHGCHPDLLKLQADVWGDYNATNALYPGSWPSLLKYEAELVQMIVDLLKGGDDSCGLLTSGGSESVLVAALGYRELAKERGIQNPEIVCGMTAHGAIHKACHYFGIRLVLVAVDSVTQQFTPQLAEKHITKDTIAIYASAPTFPHGVIDDIVGLGSLAEKHGCGLHVDNCLGGIFLSFMRQNGELASKPFDFTVPGVTTISCDLHKYGYASKGSSVVAFRSKSLRRLTFHPVINVSGSFYVTPTLQGARSGAQMAQAWATMMHMGADGYRKSAAELHETTLAMKRDIEAMPELQLLCEPDAAIIPFIPSQENGSDMIEMSTLVKEMSKRGWTLFTSQKPSCVSVCIGEQHRGLLPTWCADLRSAVSTSRQLKLKQPASGSSPSASSGGATVLGPYSADGQATNAQEVTKMANKLKDHLDQRFKVARL